MTLPEPQWDPQGLAPAIVQDAENGTVLMLAWMNREAWQLTVDTGLVHFWSRSRRALWKKGETSGHFLHVVELRLDCDRRRGPRRGPVPHGPTCHTGRDRLLLSRPTNGVDDGGAARPRRSIASSAVHRRRGGARDRHAPATPGRCSTPAMPKILAKIAEEHGELAAELIGLAARPRQDRARDRGSAVPRAWSGSPTREVPVADGVARARAAVRRERSRREGRAATAKES
jgi:phosphoribosyl-AMP cyclohydrolase